MWGSGRRQPPAVLVWLQCGYRCFTLLLVKLSEREKWLPLFVWEGKSEPGSGEFSVYGWSIDILIHDLSLSVECFSDAFQSSAHIVFESDLGFAPKGGVCVGVF